MSNVLPEGARSYCPACLGKIDVSGLKVGNEFACPACEVSIQAPVQEEVFIKGAAKIFCHCCSAKLDVSSMSEGDEFPCPGCSSVIEVPYFSSADSLKRRLRDRKKAQEQDKKPIKIRCSACDQKMALENVPAFSKLDCAACGKEMTVPKKLGNFLLEECLHEDEQFSVYRALDLSLDRVVCIKSLSPGLTAKRGTSLLQSVKKLISLNQASIVPVYSCEELDGRMSIISRYVKEKALLTKALRKYGQLDMSLVKKMTGELVACMSYVQKNSIIHGNLTPNNIFLDGDGGIVITDFGARQASLNKEQKRSPRHINQAFNLPYMAPEFLLNGELSEKSDIYSFAVILYKALTGEVPFKSTDSKSLLREIQGQNISAPIDLNNAVPQNLSDLLIQALSYNESSRVQSWDLFKQAFEGKSTKAKAITPLPAENLQAALAASNKSGFSFAKFIVGLGVVALLAVAAVSLDWDQIGSKASGYMDVVQGEVDEGVEKYQKSQEELAIKREAEKQREAASILDTERRTAAAAKANAATDEFLALNQELSEVVPEGVGFNQVVDLSLTPKVPTATSWQVPRVNLDFRPESVDMNFNMATPSFVNYLNQQSDVAKKLEMKRLELLAYFKEYLVSSLLIHPYQGDVFYQSEDAVQAKVFIENGQLQIFQEEMDLTLDLQFADLPTKQYLLILSALAGRKEQMAKKFNDQALKQSAAYDYFYAALLSDWFALPAEDYRARAIFLDPSIQNQVNAFLPTRAID